MGTQFSAFYLAVIGIKEVAAEESRGITFKDLFTNSIFRDIVISLASTIGLYILASLIHVRVFSCFSRCP